MAERDFFKYVIHRRCLLCCLLITLALVSIITFAARSSLERLTTAISDTSASIVRTAYADDASSSPANQATIPRLTVYQAPATVPNASGANLSVALDGQAVSFDVQPFIKSGRVMVPVRAISEALGAVVRYDDSTMTVTITKGSNVIILIVGSSVADEDGNPIMLDVPAEVVDGRIFVPIRFVAEAMGCQVDWFEGANYAYNLDNGLNHWRAALADLDAGSSTLYNLCVLGDSIAEGKQAGSGATQNTTTMALWITNGFCGRIRNALQARGYSDGGVGFIPAMYPQGAGWWFTFAPAADWNQNTSPAFGVCGTNMVSWTENDTVTWSFVGTGVGVVLLTNKAGGTYSITIDGGSANNFNSSTAGSDVNTIVTVTGLTNGPHTAVLKNTQVGAALVFLGAYPIVNSSGIRVNMCAYGGTTAESQAQNSSTLGAAIDIWTPILTIIQCGAADYLDQTPIATYTAAMQQIITDALQYGDVIILAPEPIAQTPDAGGIPETSYVAADLQLAVTNNCAFLDLFNRWGGGISLLNPQTLGFVPNSVTDVHPCDYGHQDMANFIMSALLEGHSSDALTSKQ